MFCGLGFWFRLVLSIGASVSTILSVSTIYFFSCFDKNNYFCTCGIGCKIWVDSYSFSIYPVVLTDFEIFFTLENFCVVFFIFTIIRVFLISAGIYVWVFMFLFPRSSITCFRCPFHFIFAVFLSFISLVGIVFPVCFAMSILPTSVFC